MGLPSADARIRRRPKMHGPRRRPLLIALSVVLGLSALATGIRMVQLRREGERRVTVCGVQLCRHGQAWFLYGATVYDPGMKPALSGIDNPAGTVALARAAHLNTIRLVNYYPDVGDPAVIPFDTARWVKVDRMIAAAAQAGMTVSLDLADYRNILWNGCVNPYTADWSRFIAFVAGRRNTITGERYSADPALSFVSVAGEPLPVGSHSFAAPATGAACTISYSTAQLTEFYRRTLGQWTRLSVTVPVTTGGLGFLDFNSGIDWRAIFALHDDAVCAVKTYGGMLRFVATVAASCASIGKPVLDEEFGWPQSDGDASRARSFDDTLARLRSLGVSGAAFWNLGYEVADTSYEVNPHTPRVFAALQRNAPPS